MVATYNLSSSELTLNGLSDILKKNYGFVKTAKQWLDRTCGNCGNVGLQRHFSTLT